MLIYYIAKIEGDLYYLKTPKGNYSKTVNTDGLIETSKTNTIVGYNRVTGKVSVKTAEDVFGYINSRRKLTGLKPLDSCVRSIESAEVFYNERTNILTFYVTDKDSDDLCMDSLYDTVELKWSDIFSVDIEKIVNKPCDINLELDINSYREIKGQKGYLYKDIQLSEITVVNEDMFYNCEKIDGLFRFNFVYTKNPELDMSKCRFRQPFTATEMFMNGTIHKFPKDFIKYLRNCDNLCYNCSLDYSIYKDMSENGHETVNRSKVFDSCKVIGEISFDKIARLQGLIDNGTAIKTVVFDRSDYAFDILNDTYAIDSIKITAEYKGTLSEESLKVLKEFLPYISLKPEIAFNDDISGQGMFVTNLKYLSLGITSDLNGMSVRTFLKDRIKDAVNQGHVFATTMPNPFYMNRLIKKFYKHINSYVNNAQVFHHLAFHFSNLGKPIRVISNLDDEEVRIWWFILTAVNDATIFDDYKYNLERYKDK